MMRRKEGVSPVIAVILMIAITVVLAGVAWYMVSGLIGNIDVPPTTIDLVRDPEISNPSESKIIVGGVDKTYNLHNFKAYLAINDVMIYSCTINPLIDGTAGNLTFVDVNQDGKLTTGDFFKVSVGPKTDYKIMLFWINNDSLITQEEWTEA